VELDPVMRTGVTRFFLNTDDPLDRLRVFGNLYTYLDLRSARKASTRDDLDPDLGQKVRLSLPTNFEIRHIIPRDEDFHHERECLALNDTGSRDLDEAATPMLINSDVLLILHSVLDVVGLRLHHRSAQNRDHRDHGQRHQ
jgi:hypothetical protein